MDNEIKKPYKESEAEKWFRIITKEPLYDKPKYKTCSKCGALSQLDATMCWKCGKEI